MKNLKILENKRLSEIKIKLQIHHLFLVLGATWVSLYTSERDGPHVHLELCMAMRVLGCFLCHGRLPQTLCRSALKTAQTDTTCSLSCVLGGKDLLSWSRVDCPWRWCVLGKDRRGREVSVPGCCLEPLQFLSCWVLCARCLSLPNGWLLIHHCWLLMCTSPWAFT